MNKFVKEAKEKDMFNNYIPELEVGDVVMLKEVWDGNGDIPDDSASYLFFRSEGGIEDYINYEFEIVEENEEDCLETWVKITDIYFY